MSVSAVRELDATPFTAQGELESDPLWYKDAVIYELHIKAYADGNGDGIGDFRGLTEQLDHVQSLGVNTIWLLPFYPSPLRDDGYDVADYENVHPYYGTLDDFRAFVAEAHRRGLRVITELVVNHTSDQHPWFQAARQAPKGSPERDFYVWSDDPKLYSGTRIIFTDTEKSNWTWDEVAGQYFWHRFFSHQPDLNFDNPAVLRSGAEHHGVLARDGRRRLPARRHSLPDRARRHEQREPARDARRHQGDPRAASTRTTRAACCWPRPTCGPRTCASTSATATNATWRTTSR